LILAFLTGGLGGDLDGCQYAKGLLQQEDSVERELAQPQNLGQHDAHRQQDIQEQLQVRETIQNWIEKMKNPKLENPIFEPDSNDGDKHWIRHCTDGSLKDGLAFNEKGQIEGHGEIAFDKDSFCSKTFQVSKVDGTFVDGLLNGEASIQFKNLTSFVASFRRGVASGLARTFSCRFGHCDFEDDRINSPDWLTEVNN